MMLNKITAWLSGYVMRFFLIFYSVFSFYLLVPWTHLSAAGQTRIKKKKIIASQKYQK
jgi:hypothetical protein